MTKEEKRVLTSNNYEQIDKRVEESKKALDYMAEHPLTHDEAIEQTQRLKTITVRYDTRRKTTTA